MACGKNQRRSISAEQGTFEFGAVIGQGNEGRVRLVRNVRTGELAVVKSKRRTHLRRKTDLLPTEAPATAQEVVAHEIHQMRESAIIMSLDHPNIIRGFATQQGKRHFYSLMEYFPGQDLIAYTVSRLRLHEAEARHIFKQLLLAVDYVHRNGIVHRDIKLDNIRINPQTKHVVLVDFGYACFYDKSGQKLEVCTAGSALYAAPEVFARRKHVGPEADVWSLGVCLYAMTTGRFPFDACSAIRIADLVVKGDYVVPSGLSSGLTSLIRSMMTVNLLKRVTLRNAMHHPWITHGDAHYPRAYGTFPLWGTLGNDMLTKDEEEVASLLVKCIQTERPLGREYSKKMKQGVRTSTKSWKNITTGTRRPLQSHTVAPSEGSASSSSTVSSRACPLTAADRGDKDARGTVWRRFCKWVGFSRR
ncbi:hypothetical protein SeLEV6574_g02669 [Synchytrium endobioticum]|uniref:Protein kinase domain-containing protein n=1 Tax=Synchytrium endobioticum TaxID=286115 RepID=A0A507D706_9FUNG|nr:hypothetical protein SeLEV6574_g02669 [Synchytrium endobioticum]